MELKDLRLEIQQFGMARIALRLERLKARHFVLFPVLRAKLLLRKLRKLETL